MGTGQRSLALIVENDAHHYRERCQSVRNRLCRLCGVSSAPRTPATHPWHCSLPPNARALPRCVAAPLPPSPSPSPLLPTTHHTLHYTRRIDATYFFILHRAAFGLIFFADAPLEDAVHRNTRASISHPSLHSTPVGPPLRHTDTPTHTSTRTRDIEVAAMKRARAPSSASLSSSDRRGNGALSPPVAASESDALGTSIASSSSSSSAVAEFDERAAAPLLSALVPVLEHLREGEVFAAALRRLATDKSTTAFDALTQLHQTAMTQHEFVMMRLTREAVLLRALEEARRSHKSLPPVWMMRWSAKPSVEHGPFTHDVVAQWARDGFFRKKEAELRDVNAVGQSWRPALSVLEKS